MNTCISPPTVCCALYTDDDDIIYEYKRCIGINGINIAAWKGDLLDRSVILGCEMLPNTERVEQKVLDQQLESMTAEILGGILDTVVKALNIYPTVQLEKLYRLADFTRWGCAIAEALNIDRQLFLDAYDENVKAQSEETLKASLPATVLIAFMDLYPEGVWRGAPTILYDELTNYAEELKINTRRKSWPGSATWLMRRLAEVEPSLYSNGITIEKDRTSRTRVVTIRKTLGDSVNGVTSVTNHDVNDAKDGTLQSFTKDVDGDDPDE